MSGKNHPVHRGGGSKQQHRPPYNFVIGDDKSYPYIVVTKEAFPRVLFTRNPRRGGGKVFGPYTSAYAVRDTLNLLHKVFPLIPCGKSWTGKAGQRESEFTGKLSTARISPARRHILRT